MCYLSINLLLVIPDCFDSCHLQSSFFPLRFILFLICLGAS
uniref:Uncharacterized protein n=1 Tax=Rhizophora mucronata TaxID=61149 RepID=A0A2P2PP77_RHIMU